MKHYKSSKYSKPDTWLEFSSVQPNLEEAIRVSSLCINQYNKRHPHQYRIKEKSLHFLNSILLEQIKHIKRVRDFDSLFSIIDNINILGIGDLTKYDVAQRIGMYLKIYPDKIYVHRGTKIGAQYILGKIKTRTIKKTKLPSAFYDANISCADLEDILCIYKDRFKSRV